MSGIFRGSNSPNSGNANINDRTPNKRASFSAFCASPGTLQDVTTMDNSYFSYRSPCVSGPQFQGSISPIIQGRSVREFDEQMQALRKENFNLRLRMYFIEETLPTLQHLQTPEGNEAVMKELIDTKVEMEMLRRDVQEKQEILKDAAQAISQMEQIQKDTETKNESLIEEMKEKIQNLELERDMERANNNDLFENTPSVSTTSNIAHRIHELEATLKQCQDKLQQCERQITEHSDLVKQRDETIKEYEEKVKEMVFQNAELLETLENKDAQLENVERSLRGLRNAIAESNEEKQKLVAMLKEHQNLYRREIKNMKLCENQIRSQQHSLLDIEERKLILQQNERCKDTIDSIHRECSDCYSLKQKSIYQQSIQCDCGRKVNDKNYPFMSSRDCGDCHDLYKKFELKQQILLNICNCSKYSSNNKNEIFANKWEANDHSDDGDTMLANPLPSCSNITKKTNNFESMIPVRYTLDDEPLFECDNCETCSSSLNQFPSIELLASSIQKTTYN